MQIQKNIDLYEQTGKLEYLANALMEFKARYPNYYEKWAKEMIRKIKKQTKN